MEKQTKATSDNAAPRLTMAAKGNTSQSIPSIMRMRIMSTTDICCCCR